MRIGQQIKKLRKMRELSQNELAKKLKNLNQSQLSKIETGYRKATASDLIEIAEALNLPISDLVSK